MKSAQNSKKSVKRGRPFKPGQSGNPGGRPKTAKFSEEVREFLSQRRGGKTRLKKVLENLEKHDPKILLYYAFGKPAESVELSSPDIAGSLDNLAVAVAQALAQKLDATPNAK